MDVRVISAAEHRDWLADRSEASFMQYPSWGRVKLGWRAESLGWSRPSGELVGTALVLYRQMPRLKRYLAYNPEGPVIDWDDVDLSRWLSPLADHLRRRGGFTVKMGPRLPLSRWSAETIRRGAAHPGALRLADLQPDNVDARGTAVASRLAAVGWRRNVGQGGNFSDYQPRHVFELPLAGRSLAEPGSPRPGGER